MDCFYSRKGILMNNNNNKILITLTVSALLVLFAGKIMVDKIVDRVIQKLQKEYSPSPYGPGFDPDKIDIEKLIKEKNQ
jgi:hypothetical protein